MPRRALLALVLVVASTGGACSWRPGLAEPISVVRAQTSYVYDATGGLITELHAEQDRRDVRFEEIPEHFRDAVVAIEDARFYDHGGVDLQAVARAALANVREGGVAEGGSTITQQYVKNVLLEPDRTIERKIQEAALALQLEDRFTKDKILELYLNTIYFGNGAYGVDAAARRYFGVPVRELTVPQAALLAGLIQSPSRHDPFRNPDGALARRNEVLERMVEQGLLPRADAGGAAATPVALAPAPPAENERYPAAHFLERVKRFVLDDERFGATPEAREALLFGGGLRIHTTLDPTLQRAAEETVARILPDAARDPEAAVVTLEPRTGEVRALVGGRDFFGDAPHAKFDLATLKGRPAGSSFKPLVLAAAIERDFPLSRVYPAPGAMAIPLPGGAWTVENYGGQNGGDADLVEATVRSYNTVYAQLMMQVGPADAVEFAHRVGISSPLAELPATVLGVNDVTPLEMAAAYGTFANRGIRVSPTFVTKITRPDGTILYDHQRDAERVVEASVADRLTAVLTQVIARGTGTRADIGRPAAGKTGTGQDWTDAWFVGYTPQLSTAVWVGFPEGQVSMTPPRTRERVTGGGWPAQIWQEVMASAHAALAVQEFPLPAEQLPEAVPSKPVPEVVGLAADQAAALLERDGWIVKRRELPNQFVDPGTVFGQVPGPSEQAPIGSEVVIDVSTGTVGLAAVPSLLGLTREEARARLAAAGFGITSTVAAEPTAPSATGRWGLVWRQTPGSGTILTVGATVEVWVNPDKDGSPPTTTTTEPGNGKKKGGDQT